MSNVTIFDHGSLPNLVTFETDDLLPFSGTFLSRLDHLRYMLLFRIMIYYPCMLPFG